MNGRALTTAGALTTTAANIIAPVISGDCETVSITTVIEQSEPVLLYPNPIKGMLTIKLNDESDINRYELRIYDTLGIQIIESIITQQTISLEKSNFPTGIYFYKIFGNGKTIQSGKLIAQ